jgi:hypothetical protein
MARKPNRFTIYDMMEQKGVFERNPANADSVDGEGASLYKGPVQFPKMVYHPQGLERVTIAAEAVVTPLGPRMVGEQRELIWALAENQDRYDELKADGWHDSPQRALAAAGKVVLPEDPNETIARLEAQIAEMNAAKSVAQADALAESKAVGQTKSGSGKLLNSD